MAYGLDITISLVILMGTIVIIYLVLEIKKSCGRPKEEAIRSFSVGENMVIDPVGSNASADSVEQTLDISGSSDYITQDMQPAILEIDKHRKTNIPDNVYDMKGNKVTIGRKGDNDIVIYDPIVSRYHCIITYSNGIFFIEDLGSTNGTFVDRKRIVQKAFLDNTCEIVIGNISIAFRSLTGD